MKEQDKQRQYYVGGKHESRAPNAHWRCLLFIAAAAVAAAINRRDDDRNRGSKTLILAAIAAGFARAHQRHDVCQPTTCATHRAEDRASSSGYFECDPAAPEELVAHPEPVFAQEHRFHLQGSPSVHGAWSSALFYRSRLCPRRNC